MIQNETVPEPMKSSHQYHRIYLTDGKGTSEGSVRWKYKLPGPQRIQSYSNLDAWDIPDLIDALQKLEPGYIIRKGAWRVSQNPDKMWTIRKIRADPGKTRPITVYENWQPFIINKLTEIYAEYVDKYEMVKCAQQTSAEQENPPNITGPTRGRFALADGTDSISITKPIFRTGNSLVIAITDAAKLMGWQKGDVVELTLRRVAHGENCKINED